MEKKARFKLGKDSLTYLIIKYPQHSNTIKRYSIDKTRQDPEGGINRLERKFLQGNPFEWAVLFDKNDKKLAYYHPKTGTQKLTKEQYYDALGKGSLKIYLIYTAAHRRATGRVKGDSFKIEDMSDVEQYFNSDVERINVYKNSILTHYYKNGQFFEA